MMQYLVTGIGKPFFTNWFNTENFNPGMVVYDLAFLKFTTDGQNWKRIETDKL